jgi:hypothetical protein
MHALHTILARVQHSFPFFFSEDEFHEASAHEVLQRPHAGVVIFS